MYEGLTLDGAYKSLFGEATCTCADKSSSPDLTLEVLQRAQDLINLREFGDAKPKHPDIFFESLGLRIISSPYLTESVQDKRVKKRQDRRRNHRVRARFRICLRRFPDIVKPMSDIIFMGDEVLMHPKVLASLKNFT
jgi:hypothetical protein